MSSGFDVCLKRRLIFMKKNDFKNKLQQLLLQDIEEMDYLEKIERK